MLPNDAGLEVKLALARQLFEYSSMRTFDDKGFTRAAYGEGKQIVHDMVAAPVCSKVAFWRGLVSRSWPRRFSTASCRSCAADELAEQWRMQIGHVSKSARRRGDERQVQRTNPGGLAVGLPAC